jgi:DNA-binding transcriptional MerR regulator
LVYSGQDLYDACMNADGYLRIGELSRRTGVSPELLRAWERRYGLFEPARSPGRFRLYSDADLARVEAMKAQLERGLSAAEAARMVLAAPAAPSVAVSATAVDEPTRALRAALDAFDEPGANAAIDRLLASLSVESFLRDVVVPLLRELGERWERGETTVAQEHFASSVLRGRLLALARGWGRGHGPHALLAAPPGELHDLGLLVFGLALRNQGWRVTFLGADTPIDTIADAARRMRPDLVVLATLMHSRLGLQGDAVRELAREWRVAISGDGTSEELAASLGTEYVAEGPIEAAERLASPPVRARA